jgi:hypothetical protein
MEITKKMYVGPEKIMDDFDISKAKAYAIIHMLNEELKKTYPEAIVVAGKVNRIWYDKACLKQPLDRNERLTV